MLHFLFAAILIIHQFLFSSRLENSYEEPKWLWISVGILLFWLLVQWNHRKSKDLSYPGRRQWYLVLLLAIPVLVDFAHGSRFWLHSFGLACVAYSMPYLLHRGGLSISRAAPTLFILILCACGLDWSGLLPMIHGPLYHLSGFVGNPNLLGACLVFWFWLARDRIKHKNIFFLLCLAGALLTLSRAAVLALFITEALRRFRASQKLAAFLILLLCSGAAYYSIHNPHQVREFSSLKIRELEMGISLNILKDNWWGGIGQGAYRQEYYQRLDGKFAGVKSFEDRPDYQWIRLSSTSHQSFVGLFLWLGIPAGLVFLFLVVQWLIWIFPHLSQGERLALFSLLLMSQVYDLLSFSVLSIPCIFIFCRGAACCLSENTHTSLKRWIPLAGLCAWAVFWYGTTNQSLKRFEANSRSQFEALLQSPFRVGEDYHQFARWMLNQPNQNRNPERIRSILHEAHSLSPDPSTAYHLALVAMQDGNSSEARKILERGLETLPTFAPYYYGLALLSDNPTDEEAIYLLALKVDNGYYQAWKNLGILLFEKGDYQRSAYSFSQGIYAYSKKNDMGRKKAGSLYLRQLEEGRDKASELFRMKKDRRDSDSN